MTVSQPTSARSIAAHGLIGDLHTAALVATDGTIDWFCPGRFDAPSMFASILDEEAGGERQTASARLADGAGSPTGPLQTMYRVDGSADLRESELATSPVTRIPAPCASATTRSSSCSWTSTAS